MNWAKEGQLMKFRFVRCLTWYDTIISVVSSKLLEWDEALKRAFGSKDLGFW